MDLDVTQCLRGVLPFRPLNAPWMGLVKAVLGTEHVRNIQSEEGGRYGFGCVVSKPGDGEQNWHQDGDTTRGGDEPARTVIVFFAPTPITREQGGGGVG